MASVPRPIQIQSRDIRLLIGLFESRVMTMAHIAALYFDGKCEAAKKRLQKLKSAGLITERKRKTYEPSVLILTRKGINLLRTEGILTKYPRFSVTSLEKRSQVKDLTLRHELAVMDVKTAIHKAIRATSTLSLAEFSTWPILSQFNTIHSATRTSITVKPDGFVRIHEKESDGAISEHTFFFELDRSTETQDTLVLKASCYLDYYRSGGFAARNGAERSEYKEYPFRVLMVFKTAERRNNTAERLLQHTPPILTHTYLTTFDKVSADPLGAIWVRPVDYRNVIEGTPFETANSTPKIGYRRSVERDDFVESIVSKVSLLAD